MNRSRDTVDRPVAAAPPRLPAAGAAGPATARRAITGPARHALRQLAADAGHPLEATLLCAFGDVLAAWSDGSPAGITLRRIDPHAPHHTGLPAAGTVTTITAVTDPAVPFTDRVAATGERLRARPGHRVPAAAAPAPGGCLLTIRPAHTPCAPPARPEPLACTVTVRSGELCVDWAGAGLPPGVLDDIADAYDELLRDLADDPGAWRATYREHLPARQRVTRARVNATAGPVPDTLLHEPFLRQAGRTPRAPAVVTDDRTVTYAELRTAATGIAARLHRAGARPDRLAAVVLDKGWQQVAAVLGVLAAGAAYVPLAPDLPGTRLRQLLDHAGAGAVLTTPELARALAWPAGVAVLPVTDDLLTETAPAPAAARRDPADLAYVIYTSGSTGEPKGVMISHRAAGNTIADINRRHRVGPADRVLALASLSFDLSVYDIFGPLAVGGSVVVPAPGTARAPWYWLDAVTAHRVTVWNSVPALMQMLTVYATARGERLPDSLRLVLLSGDWIPVTLPDIVRALAAGPLDIIGMGGATEASIWSNDYRITRVDPRWPSIPYGTPLTNQSFEVLDADLRRRPDWVTGELYIGGTGLATGYWQDAARTAAAFIHHPRTGQRLYRTGDLGRYLPDGNLEFVGRNDFQVKIQGFRVELGEIEAALLGHPHVAAAAVTAVGPATGERRLLGYAVPKDPATAAGLAARLRDHLAERLPAYMVPTGMILLDALPLSANGKVDRAALPTA